MASPTDASVAQQQAVDTYFDGDRPLYEAFRASCLRQFHEDARQCDAACASGDLLSLRRVVHSLKTVLLTLGHPVLAAHAAAVEHRAAAGASDACQEWVGLRTALLSLAASPAPP
ncbi:Hpt domain-containing protein [Ideonella sp. A 288]|uniref:Hpt domain-containing protein n=1 Tax=Ideonella sp. A 288 TaxID=1962181 RepID=UPI001184852C|nr:Hpt domain-containing protein [Ideonella sp. A 288]